MLAGHDRSDGSDLPPWILCPKVPRQNMFINSNFTSSEFVGFIRVLEISSSRISVAVTSLFASVQRNPVSSITSTSMSCCSAPSGLEFRSAGYLPVFITCCV